MRKLLAADGLVIGSPAYSAKCSPAAQALMVRAEATRRAGVEHPLACKVAGAVVDARSPGSAGTYRALIGWFRAHEMIVVEASPSVREARAGAGDGDGGAAAMAELGRTMAWTLRRLAS